MWFGHAQSRALPEVHARGGWGGETRLTWRDLPVARKRQYKHKHIVVAKGGKCLSALVKRGGRIGARGGNVSMLSKGMAMRVCHRKK